MRYALTVRCDILYMLWLDIIIIICEFYVISHKGFLKTHRLLSPFDLRFKCFSFQGSCVEAMRRLVQRHYSLVNEGRQSYSLVVHGVLAMASHITLKESVRKQITS